MADPLVVRGVIHGKTIELAEETSLPDGQQVTLHVIPEPQLEEAPEADAEAEQTLQTIYGMRHMGRSVIQP
jgi:hypothetical protein